MNKEYVMFDAASPSFSRLTCMEIWMRDWWAMSTALFRSFFSFLVFFNRKELSELSNPSRVYRKICVKSTDTNNLVSWLFLLPIITQPWHGWRTICLIVFWNAASALSLQACPICSVKVARDMPSHFTLQHGHLFKISFNWKLRSLNNFSENDLQQAFHTKSPFKLMCQSINCKVWVPWISNDWSPMKNLTDTGVCKRILYRKFVCIALHIFLFHYENVCKFKCLALYLLTKIELAPKFPLTRDYLQRRRIVSPNSQALSLLGRDLYDAHLQALLGDGGCRSNNTVGNDWRFLFSTTRRRQL